MSENRTLPCPICNEPMSRQAKHDVTIDVCDEHGIWLDRGELDILLLRASKRMRKAVRKGTAKAAERASSDDGSTGAAFFTSIAGLL